MESPSGEGENADSFQRVIMVVPGRNTAAIGWLKKSESVSAAAWSLSIRPQADLVQQALVADGAIACLSSNVFSAQLEC